MVKKTNAMSEIVRACIQTPDWRQQFQRRSFESYAQAIYRLGPEVNVPQLSDAVNIPRETARSALYEAERRGIVERAGVGRGKHRRYVVFKVKS